MEQKTSILIVDDSESQFRTMSLILERKGYDVSTAMNGPDAMEKVRETPFDLIFMDMKMPQMDGVETYKGVREIMPDAVVIMMTAYAVDDLIQEALRDGAHGIIYKPLDIEKVLGLIKEVKQARPWMLVMVVDDDSGTCITMRNILLRRGCEVSIAHTGEEAIAAARERVHDVIFMDVRLPTINGLETYFAIREINLEVVVVMMTGYGQEVRDMVEEALKNNAYTCLYKPLDMDAVLRFVDEVWRKKQRVG